MKTGPQPAAGSADARATPRPLRAKRVGINRKSWPPSSPDGTDWLNLLGSVLNGSHEDAREARRHFTRTARKLRDAAE